MTEREVDDQQQRLVDEPAPVDEQDTNSSTEVSDNNSSESTEDSTTMSPSEVADLLHESAHPDWVDDSDEFDEVKPRVAFDPPRFTGMNGWRKWHTARDCGRNTVYYIEDPMSDSMSSDAHAWSLYCASCGHQIRWDQALYLDEDWYYRQLFSEDMPSSHMKLFRDAWLNPEWVAELNGLPSDEEVQDVLRRSAYEIEARVRHNASPSEE